jgi:hypothetical protein
MLMPALVVASHVSALATVTVATGRETAVDLLVSGGVDGSLRLWHLPSAKALHEINIGAVSVSTAAALCSRVHHAIKNASDDETNSL